MAKENPLTLFFPPSARDLKLIRGRTNRVELGIVLDLETFFPLDLSLDGYQASLSVRRAHNLDVQFSFTSADDEILMDEDGMLTVSLGPAKTSGLSELYGVYGVRLWRVVGAETTLDREVCSGVFDLVNPYS